MILDRYPFLSRYAVLGARFETAVRFLRENPPASLPDGRTEIDAENVFAVMRTEKLDPQANQWEIHRRYADIQMVIEGREAIDAAPATLMAPQADYNAQRDVEFYRDLTGVRCVLNPGDFLILFPGEPHAPNRAAVPGDSSKKLLIKILMED